MAAEVDADSLNREWTSYGVPYRLWKSGVGDLWAISSRDDDRIELLIIGNETTAVRQARTWLQASTSDRETVRT